jgi:hypothetical protein
MRSHRALIVLTLAIITHVSAQDFRLLRSTSGPSGKVQAETFTFDEVRSRFVHPQDKSFIVYFEWEGPRGTHTLSAIWKRPDGQVDSISPDARIESPTNKLACYWTYTLTPTMMNGIWSVEIRIDGQPAGSHPFEIAGTLPPQTVTLDRVFQNASPSMVWVRKLNAAGKREDTASGFVIGKDQVVTAFQAIDGAVNLEVEFSGGRKIATDRILDYSRSGDWAILSVTTADIAPLETADDKSIAVGSRLIVFNVEGDARTFGGVDISGKRTVPGIGGRVQISPWLSLASAGGPLLNPEGKVVAIIGGSVIPGSRFSRQSISVNPALGISTSSVSAATPISEVTSRTPGKPATLGELASSGALTAALTDIDAMVYVGTSNEMSKNASDRLPLDVCEFSRGDKQVWVFVSMAEERQDGQGPALREGV